MTALLIIACVIAYLAVGFGVEWVRIAYFDGKDGDTAKTVFAWPALLLFLLIAMPLAYVAGAVTYHAKRARERRNG